MPGSTPALPGPHMRVLKTNRSAPSTFSVCELAALMLTVCDSSLVSFLEVDLQSREEIANCLRSQIKEQIV